MNHEENRGHRHSNHNDENDQSMLVDDNCINVEAINGSISVHRSVSNAMKQFET